MEHKALWIIFQGLHFQNSLRCGWWINIATLSYLELERLPIGIIYVRHVYLLAIFGLILLVACWPISMSFEFNWEGYPGPYPWAIITLSSSGLMQSIGGSHLFKNCLVLFQGSLRDATGIFPCDFVSVIKDLPQEEDPINWLRCYYHDDNVSSIR